MYEINYIGLTEFELVLLDKKLSKSILSDMFEYSSNPKLYKFMCELEVHENISDTAKYLKKIFRRIDKENFIYWAILNKNKKAIGTVCIQNKNNKSEISYAISPKYWGTNCIFYVLYCIFSYVISNKKIDTIEAVTQSNNRNSIHLLRFCGFSIDKRLREYYNCIHGGKIDALWLEVSVKDINLERIIGFIKLLDNNIK